MKNYLPRFSNFGILWLFLLTLLLSSCHQSKVWNGYVEGRYTYLSSNTDGYLQQLNVERGTPVKPGQLMFVLENQPQAAQLEEARGKLEQAQYNLTNLVKGQRLTILKGIQEQIRQASANLELAKITYERDKQLWATQAIAKQTFDQAEAQFKSANARFNELMANLSEAELGARTDVIASAQAAVITAQAEVNSAEWYVAKKSITAPLAGTTYDTYFRVGEFVPAGRPVLSMLAPRDIKIIFYVPEPQLNRIKLGDEITISCDGCQQKYTGKIVFIADQAEYTPPQIYSETERKKFVFRVEARFIDLLATNLHPGQPVNITLKKSA